MPSKNVNLTEHHSEFVDHLVASGRYKNASEVLRAGLRLLEQSTTEQEQKLALLRRLAAEGFEQLDQGGGIELPTEQRLSAHIATLGRQAAKTARRRRSGILARSAPHRSMDTARLVDEQIKDGECLIDRLSQLRCLLSQLLDRQRWQKSLAKVQVVLVPLTLPFVCRLNHFI